MSDASSERITVAAVVLAGLFARLHRFRQQPVRIDEAITLSYIQTMAPGELVSVLPVVQPHFPTYYLLLDAWLGVFGMSVHAARIPSVIAGVVTLWLVYRVGRHLDGSRTGVVAAAIVALSPFFIRISLLVRMYALFAMLATAGWLAILNATTAPTPRRRRQWQAVSLALAITTMYLHYFGGVVVVSQLAYLGWRQVRTDTTWRKWWPLYAGSAVSGLPAAGWIIARLLGWFNTATPETGSNPRTAIFGLQPPTTLDLAEFTIQTFTGTWIASRVSANFLVVLTVVTVAGIAIHYARQDKSSQRISMATTVTCCWFGVPLLIAVVVSHVIHPVFRPRYVVAAAVAIPLATAGSVVHARPRIRTSMMSVLGVVLVVSMAFQYAYPGYQGWTHAGAYIERTVDDDAELIAVGFFQREAMFQASRLPQPLVDTGRTVQDVRVPPDPNCQCEIVVVVNEKSVFGPADTVAAQDVGLSPNAYEQVSYEQVRRIGVYRFQPVGAR
jgi:uncharacterized membrane protein